MKSLTKNQIIGIAAGLGVFLSVVSAGFQNWSLMGFFLILTVFISGMVYLLYGIPDGETCTPKKDDPNATSWVTKDGLCVPSGCSGANGYFLVTEDSKGLPQIPKCEKPTSLPYGWTEATSNSFTVTSPLSTSQGLDENMCAYSCLNTPQCVLASYDSSKNCILFGTDGRGAPGVDKGPQVTYLARPKK